jgi:hypothetical protein
MLDRVARERAKRHRFVAVDRDQPVADRTRHPVDPDNPRLEVPPAQSRHRRLTRLATEELELIEGRLNRCPDERALIPIAPVAPGGGVERLDRRRSQLGVEEDKALLDRRGGAIGLLLRRTRDGGRFSDSLCRRRGGRSGLLPGVGRTRSTGAVLSRRRCRERPDVAHRLVGTLVNNDRR